MKKLLILYDYFDPAYKAGGPIRSLVNLVKLLERDMEIFILTSNQDHDGSVLEVKPDEWLDYGGKSKIKYLSASKRGYKNIKTAIQEVKPDTIYINGIYSLPYMVYALRASMQISDLRIVIAPRGMLQAGALKIKSGKKRIFLFILRFIFNFKRVIWHATDDQEKEDVKVFFPPAKVYLAGNIPVFSTDVKTKEIPKLHFVSISLLARKKNHVAFVKALKRAGIQREIIYHIFGPVSDEDYYQELSKSIKELPESIKVEIRGSLKPSEIAGILQKYRFYVLTSFGENFGHSIFEAFNLGVPVIISDQTPWKGLRQHKAGWDVDLSDEKALISAIEEALWMDENTYCQYQQGARRIAENYMQSHDFRKLYLGLFS